MSLSILGLIPLLICIPFSKGAITTQSLHEEILNTEEITVSHDEEIISQTGSLAFSVQSNDSAAQLDIYIVTEKGYDDFSSEEDINDITEEDLIGSREGNSGTGGNTKYISKGVYYLIVINSGFFNVTVYMYFQAINSESQSVLVSDWVVWFFIGGITIAAISGFFTGIRYQKKKRKTQA